MKSNILKKIFFLRSPVKVAPDLLGKYLVMRRKNGSLLRRMITETEAYDGIHDKASHAYRGKTKRTKIMFEDGGVWYVYLIYGMHEMLNVVANKKDCPGGVLLRGVEGADGPGKLTRLYRVTRSFYGCSVSRKTGLWIEDCGVKIPKFSIKKSPRIGVDYAGPVWAKKPYRFFIDSDILNS